MLKSQHKTRSALTGKLLTESEARKVNNQFSENALKMMKKRYLAKRDDGTQETPAQMLERIAIAAAEIEKKYGKPDQEVAKRAKEFFEIMAKKEFCPAGRTITNAGAPSPVVANCIVLPIEDSMESIFKTLKDAALLQKAGSGLGFSFGKLRPAGTFVKTSAGMASGPVSFLQVYNQAFGVIKQQGRHGANMAILPVDHPDILDFVTCKKVEGDIRNFNISVGMTDEFMDAVINRPDEPWFCRFEREKVKPRRIERDRFGVVVSITELDMTAGELYQEIVENAWRNGEPGVIFLDSFNKYNTMPKTPIEATNPCGEQGLPPYDVCNLGSINLAAFVKEDGGLDKKRLEEVSMSATRFLDNVVDLFDYPVKEVQEMAKNTRRLGLGVMGYADMLYQMGIRYDSPEGFETAEEVMRIVQEASHKTSVALAEEKGEFPLWSDSTWALQGLKRRNTMVTTVAPTGSISMFFDTSSGIEPNFALAFTKQDKDGLTYKYVNQYLEKALKNSGAYSDELMDEIVREGSLENIKGVPQKIKDTFRVAMDIAPEDHIKAQAAFQKYVENSISKTINFPNEATIDDIKQGYIIAWQTGCKGCTLYRDGSREVQVLNLNKNLDKAKSLAPGQEQVSLLESDKEALREMAENGSSANVAQAAKKLLESHVVNGKGLVPRERPDVVSGVTYRLRTPYGNMYVTINRDEHGPFEIFSQLGKAGGFFQAQTEAICRMISLSLRSGISITEVIDQLKGIRGPDMMFTSGGTIHSLPDAIAKVLENHIKRGQTELALNFGDDDEVEPNPEDSLADPGQAKVKQVEDELLEARQEQVRAEVKKKKTALADFGHAPACPDCGDMLTMEEGCLNCHSCGFSKCG